MDGIILVIRIRATKYSNNNTQTHGYYAVTMKWKKLYIPNKQQRTYRKNEKERKKERMKKKTHERIDKHRTFKIVRHNCFSG